MNLRIFSITAEERDSLIESYNDKIRAAEKEMNDIAVRIAKYRDRIAELLRAEQDMPIIYDGSSNQFIAYEYPRSGILAHKAEFALRQIGSLSSTRRIADVIAEYDPGAAQNDLVSRLSATLKQKADKQEIFRRVERGTDILYGLIEWFDNEGILFPLYDRDQLL